MTRSDDDAFWDARPRETVDELSEVGDGPIDFGTYRTSARVADRVRYGALRTEALDREALLAGPFEGLHDVWV